MIIKKANLLAHKLTQWINNKPGQVMIFNISVLILSLLHTAGYFNPYFVISINIVILSSVVLAVVLLKVNSRYVFLIAVVFLLMALFFKIFLVDVWSERMGIYVFEVMIVGAISFFFEQFTNTRKKS